MIKQLVSTDGTETQRKGSGRLTTLAVLLSCWAPTYGKPAAPSTCSRLRSFFPKLTSRKNPSAPRTASTSASVIPAPIKPEPSGDTFCLPNVWSAEAGDVPMAAAVTTSHPFEVVIWQSVHQSERVLTA
jgi:hypothetical protein